MRARAALGGFFGKQREAQLIRRQGAIVVALRPAKIAVASVEQRDALARLLGHGQRAVDEHLRPREVAAQLGRLGGTTKNLDLVDSLGELRRVSEPKRPLYRRSASAHAATRAAAAPASIAASSASSGLPAPSQ